MLVELWIVFFYPLQCWVGIRFGGRAGGSSNDSLPSIEGAKTIRVTECADKSKLC